MSDDRCLNDLATRVICRDTAGEPITVARVYADLIRKQLYDEAARLMVSLSRPRSTSR